jgi:hypothetical protein
MQEIQTFKPISGAFMPTRNNLSKSQNSIEDNQMENA